ncbi:MAG TPA: YfbU family protein [Dongiaceae bacterium]|jgi:hypothetical protein|nr:YfbU family protein [Dongiaceae bacterium]
MKLSDGEKLIIAMLCDIHKAVNAKGMVDPDLVSSAISTGNLKELKWEMQGVLGDDDDEDKPAAEVDQILDMWSTIERAYKRLTAEEKEQVEAEAGPLGRGVRFSGFDGDTESEYREIAHFFIEKAGRFERFQGRNLNAHMPSLNGYRRMLRIFSLMRPSNGDTRLDVRQIIELANAEKYSG